jgi:aminoglycoside N3'-acetyltransferase
MPLAWLYDQAADVLLLAVGHDSNTSLHLAEIVAGG